MLKPSRHPWLAYLSTLVLAFGPFSKAANAGEVTIAAAASLKDALEIIKPKLEKAMPGTQLSITTGASGTLQQQIAQGAPIHIFLSASPLAMEALVKEKYVAEASRRTLLTNELVLIAAKSSQIKWAGFETLNDPKIKRIALGEPRSVPAGDYASQFLQKQKLESELKSKFLFAKDVRQVLSYVERGEVDAGFVYASDLKAKNAGAVRLLAKIPSDSHAPIIYELAVVERLIGKTSDQSKTETNKVADFLAGKEAAKIWLKFGFSLPSPKSTKKGL